MLLENEFNFYKSKKENNSFKKDVIVFCSVIFLFGVLATFAFNGQEKQKETSIVMNEIKYHKILVEMNEFIANSFSNFYIEEKSTSTDYLRLSSNFTTNGWTDLVNQFKTQGFKIKENKLIDITIDKNNIILINSKTINSDISHEFIVPMTVRTFNAGLLIERTEKVSITLLRHTENNKDFFLIDRINLPKIK